MSKTELPEHLIANPDELVLYTAGTPNGHKISTILKVLDVPFTPLLINMLKLENHQPWFIEHITSTRRIPVLVDHGHKIVESGAIVLYLIDKYDKDNKISYPAYSKEYYECLEWLFFHITNIEPLHMYANFNVMFEKPEARLPALIERNVFRLRQAFGTLENRIKEQGTGYIVGNKATYVDIITLQWTVYIKAIGIDIEKEFPEIYEWIQRMYQVKGVEEGMSTPAPFPQFAQVKLASKIKL